MDKPLKHSYSSLSTFDTCPKQFYHKQILKDVKFVQNEAAKWGSDCHDAMDKAIKAKTLPTGRFEFLAPPLESVYKAAGDSKVESEVGFGVTREKETTDFWGGWLRGKLDVLYQPQEDRAVICDWKVAKFKSYSLEVDTFSYLVFMNHPEVRDIKRVLIWLKQDAPHAPTVDKVNRSADFNRIEDTVCGKIATVERAVELDNFPAKKSGLCQAYCDVTSCQFNGKFRK